MVKTKSEKIRELAKEMTTLNNEYVVVVNVGYDECIATFMSPEKLKLPAGYQYLPKKGITKSVHRADPSYEEFRFLELVEK